MEAGGQLEVIGKHGHPWANQVLEKEDNTGETSLMTWMIQGAKTAFKKDPRVLSRLQAATAGGGTHTVSLLISNAIYEFALNPDLLEQIRMEIRRKHEETGAVWDFAAFDSLEMLDSALKETARLSPPAMMVDLLVTSDFRMSNGLMLRKGQMICVFSCSIQGDDNVFPDSTSYQGLRAFKRSLEDSTLLRPFKSPDYELRWGSGRWACPGRFLATLKAKIALVKLLDQYDFQLLSG